MPDQNTTNINGRGMTGGGRWLIWLFSIFALAIILGAIIYLAAAAWFLGIIVAVSIIGVGIFLSIRRRKQRA